MTNQNIEHFLNDLSPAGRLGIDIGRVLMCPSHDDGRPDTTFLTATDTGAMEVPAAPGMFEVVPRLVRAFGGQAWLVSKASQRIEDLTRRWMEHHAFYARTGLTPDRVRFCRRREDKRVHASELGLTHFIDDRTDVLVHLRGLVPYLGLFGVQTGPVPEWVIPVPDWGSLGAALTPESG